MSSSYTIHPFIPTSEAHSHIEDWDSEQKRAKEAIESLLMQVELIETVPYEHLVERLTERVEDNVDVEEELKSAQLIASWRKRLGDVFGIKSPSYGMFVINIHERVLRVICDRIIAQSANAEDLETFMDEEQKEFSRFYGEGSPAQHTPEQMERVKNEIEQLEAQIGRLVSGECGYFIAFVVSSMTYPTQGYIPILVDPVATCSRVSTHKRNKRYEDLPIDIAWVDEQDPTPHLANTSLSEESVATYTESLDFNGATYRNDRFKEGVRGCVLRALWMRRHLIRQMCTNKDSGAIVITIKYSAVTDQPDVDVQFGQERRRFEQTQFNIVQSNSVTLNLLPPDKEELIAGCQTMIDTAQKRLDESLEITNKITRLVKEGVYGDHRPCVFVTFQDIPPSAPITLAVVSQEDAPFALADALDSVTTVQEPSE